MTNFDKSTTSSLLVLVTLHVNVTKPELGYAWGLKYLSLLIPNRDPQNSKGSFTNCFERSWWDRVYAERQKAEFQALVDPLELINPKVEKMLENLKRDGWEATLSREDT